MKAVLISINPKWCEKIASGAKTIEVRKNRPKLEPPFKCYIYCTKPREYFFHGGIGETLDDLYRMPSGEIKFGYSGELMCCDEPYGADNFLNGKVIGEFICNEIITVGVKYNDPSNRLSLREFPFTCLTDRQVMDYLGNGVDGYGWHISELKIYGKPKELSDFKQCHRCEYYKFCEESESSCDSTYNLRRPPQSWCYVEEVL